MPRFRLTLRRMMILIACLAMVFFVVQEFWDGSPPRFVVRGIPARMERLQPGMSWQETRDILGLETSWIWGGTDAQFRGGDGSGRGNGYGQSLTYEVRPSRIVMNTWSVWPGDPPFVPTAVYRSTAAFQLLVRSDVHPGDPNWERDTGTRLVSVIYYSDSKVLSEFPQTR